MAPPVCSHYLAVLIFYFPFIRQNIYRQTAQVISCTGNTLYTEMVQKLLRNKQNALCNINRRQTQYRIVGGQGFVAHRVVAIQHRSHERLCNWNGRLQIKYCRIRRREINISREIQQDTHYSLRPGVNLHYKESKNNLAIWTDSPPRLKHFFYHVSFRMTAVFFN